MTCFRNTDSRGRLSLQREVYFFFLVKFLKFLETFFKKFLSGFQRQRLWLSHLSVTADNILVCVKLGKSHRTAGVKLLRGNSDLATESEFSAVGKTR